MTSGLSRCCVQGSHHNQCSHDFHRIRIGSLAGLRQRPSRPRKKRKRKRQTGVDRVPKAIDYSKRLGLANGVLRPRHVVGSVHMSQRKLRLTSACQEFPRS